MLIVDDEPEIVALLAEIVAPLALRLDVAADGLEALERLGVEAYDLVISDLRMPNLDGPGLLREPRQRNARAKLLLVTGDALSAPAEETLGEVGVLVLAKPFTPAEVRRLASEVVEGG